MAKHTNEELGKALGCVVYDMLILLVSLSVFRRRKQYPLIEGLKWGEPQIAYDTILLKSRSLMDFIAPRRHTREDIVITAFGQAPVTLPRAIKDLRRSINQWSARLSWQRALRSPHNAFQPDRDDTSVHAFWLLTTLRNVVSSCISAGITFMEERHKSFYHVFEREYALMVTSATVQPTITPALSYSPHVTT